MREGVPTIPCEGASTSMCEGHKICCNIMMDLSQKRSEFVVMTICITFKSRI